MFAVSRSFVSVVGSVGFRFVRVITRSLCCSSRNDIGDLAIATANGRACSFGRSDVLRFYILEVVRVRACGAYYML